MDAKLVCYCILILSGAFALLSLGLLLIRMSGAVKEATILMKITETTLEKVNHILDDINNKMEMLNAPVELVSGFFNKGALKAGLFSGLLGLKSLFSRKK
ncbi:MAG: hypothetical protein RR630_00230 [Coprobacillus sp.]